MQMHYSENVIDLNCFHLFLFICVRYGYSNKKALMANR